LPRDHGSSIVPDDTSGNQKYTLHDLAPLAEKSRQLSRSSIIIRYGVSQSDTISHRSIPERTMPSTEETPGWVTKLTSLEGDRSTLHGYDLLTLARGYDFTSLSYLAWTGELPTPAQRQMLDAVLGCVIVHGIAPTGAIARGLVRSGVPTQVAISGALLSLGDVHGGAGEALGQALEEAAARAGYTRGEPFDPELVRQCATACVDSFTTRGMRVPGLGHPAHPDGDPRARMLLERAQNLKTDGFCCAVLAEIERVVSERHGRPLPSNVDGAMTVILEDVGVGWRFSRVVLLVARAVGLGAQVIEEQLAPTPSWRKVILPNEIYLGPPERAVPQPPR
jgi:citrate synthase/citryl-CoA lyase